MKFILRIIYILIGLLALSLGTSILNAGHLGVDPFTAMNMGLSSKIGMSLGTFQIIINVIILIYIFIYNRKSIGIGTILNMTLVGYFIDWFGPILKPYSHMFTKNFFSIVLTLIVGVLLFTFGAALYMSTDEGQAPYDAIAPTLCKQLHKPYVQVRTIQDITCMLIGWISGGPIGIATIICAFGCGPLISGWTKLISPFVEKTTGAKSATSSN